MKARLATFNYQAPSVASSLHRNGAVRMDRDPDGSDSEIQGLAIEKHSLPVADARRLAGDARPTLSTNGFELVSWPHAAAGLDYLDHAEVVTKYYDSCAELVRESSGASRVFAFDHNVRSASAKRAGARISGGQQVQAPAHIVHGDYTLDGAPQRLRELARPPTTNDTLRPFLADGRSLLSPDAVEAALAPGGRFALVNVWRNIAPEPVATHPLALCDARTVDPRDLVLFEIHYADRVGENYFAKHAPRHRWYFYPEMRGEEALLIKQWDSAGHLARTAGAAADAAAADAPCTFSFHSGFKDPATPPDAPDRWSIEVRCVALYD